MIGIIYVLGFLAILQGVITFLDGIRAVRHIRTFRPKSDSTPPVAVFCPCRGIDPDLAANIASILNQDYPAFSVHFIVDSEKDPACAVLKDLNANLLVAGPAVDCGQKVHNLSYAVDRASTAAEVFVFADSDARYPRNWLRNLVAPLVDEGVAVSTGYRWYAAESGTWPSLLRSIWNASVVTTLGGHGRNFAWGGSMALRRSVFDRIRVKDFWAGTVSDDYGVTRAAQSAGMRIVFTPLCLIPSFGSCTWAELLEFTTRQMLIVRVYSPGVWRFALVTQSLFNLAFWSLFAAMWVDTLAAILWLALYGLAAAKAFMRIRAVAEVLPEGALSKRQWSYILLSPVSALLYEYNLLRSAATRQLLWRQIRYNLVSANRTVVLGGGEKS